MLCLGRLTIDSRTIKLIQVVKKISIKERGVGGILKKSPDSAF